MNKYEESLERILAYAFMYLDQRTDVTKEQLKNIFTGVLGDRRLIQELIDEKKEFESRKDKLVEGSEWLCIGTCIGIHEGSFDKGEIIIIDEPTSEATLRIRKKSGYEWDTEPMDIEQFLLCFKPMEVNNE